MDQNEVLDVLVKRLDDGRLSRRQFVRAAGMLGVAGAASAFLAACGSTPASGTPVVGTAGPGSAAPSVAPVSPVPSSTVPTGSARFLIAENFWADWAPYQSTAQSQARLTQQIYDRLIERETADISQVSPGLAKTWKQVDDTTWEFGLQEGVRFHDGQELTADDVKASVELASGATATATVLSGVWVPTTVEVVDKYTVRLKTKTPFGPLLNAVYQTPIVSAADLLAGDEQLKQHPNGTGPFRLVKNETARKTMEANVDYWRGAPSIRDLVWEFIQDPQTRLSALLANQAQVIDRVPPEHLQVLSGSPDMALSSVTGIEAVQLWCRPTRSKIWDENQKFREAVAWAIDREALVRDLVQGSSAVATSFMPVNTLFHAEQSPKYTYDPDRAKSLLAEAGYADGGPEFQLWAATGFLPRAVEAVQAIEANLKAVGLKPTIVTADVAGLIDDIFSDNGTGLMYHLSWSSSGDPHSALQPLGAPFVWAGPASGAKLDELIAEGASITDDTQRQAVYGELQEYLWGRLPHIPLYNSDFTVAYTKSLEGLLTLPDFSTRFYPARIVG